jgi:hypothetical protein
MVAARLEGQRVQPAAPAQRSRLRIAWWAYPIGAAAMLTVAMTLFSGNRPTNLHNHPGGDPAASWAIAPEILPSVNPDDSLSDLEKEAGEVASLRTAGSSFFGGADPGDVESLLGN